MSELTLQSLCDEAEALIASESFEEAIALCQHTLRFYPKHVRSYALLGKAAVGLGNAREAADMFRRVLSADPENLEARATLGEIFSGEGALDEALWQTERAFEMNPGDVEIRQRLRELRGQRLGHQPNRLKLNGVALGRLYSRSGWHDLAIKEYQALLEKDPARVDVRAALAEALWACGRRQEAAVVCEELLTELPNCLKANLILGQVWAESGLEEGWGCLQLAQSLDPENRTAQQILGDESPLPLQEVELPPVGTAPPVSVEEEPEMETAELPPWLQSLSTEELSEDLTAPAAGTPPVQEPWVIDLRAATERALASRLAPAERPREADPLWVIELRVETERALSAHLPKVDAVPQAISAEAWIAALRKATGESLARRETGVQAKPAARLMWVDQLRAAVEQALERRTRPHLPEMRPHWVDGLQAATADVLAWPVPGDWVGGLLGATTDALVARGRARWIARLHEDTATALSEREAHPRLIEVEGGAETIAAPLSGEEVEALRELVTGIKPAEQMEGIAETTPEGEPVREPSLEDEIVTEESGVATADDHLASLRKRVHAEPDNPALRLELAVGYRQAGERESALAEFNRLLHEDTEVSAEVVAALETWGESSPDDPEVQQLLGDAYASVGQLAEALTQYRRVLEMAKQIPLGAA
jgi:tetratricopeptide (TPR) repeat protein